MGKRVALAPRNSAEAVALGVSACFLLVAGVVVHGDSTGGSPPTPSTVELAAEVGGGRTYSRPAPKNAVIGSRVLLPQPPLVLLRVADQAQAKIEAAGTERGDGAVLVAFFRGAGTLPLGGAAPQAAADPSPSGPIGAVEFPPATDPGTVSAAPQVPSASPTGSAAAPAATPTGPTATTPPPDPTTPVDDGSAPVESSEPPVDEQPTTPGETGTGGGESGGSGDGGTDGGAGTDSGAGAGTDAGSATDEQDAADRTTTSPSADAPTGPGTGPDTGPAPEPGPTPEGLQD